MDDNCRPMAHQVFTHDAPGANPDVPLGTNPGDEPVSEEAVRIIVDLKTANGAVGISAMAIFAAESVGMTRGQCGERRLVPTSGRPSR